MRVHLVGCNTDCAVVTQEFNNRVFTSIDAQGYTLIPNSEVANAVTACDGTSIFGGFGVYSDQDVQKTYTGLQEHTHLFVSAKVFLLDSWGANDFSVLVDDMRVGFIRTRDAR